MYSLVTFNYIISEIVEMYIHQSLDLYAMIAITPSLPTLTALVEMVNANNSERQEYLNETGIYRPRTLNVSIFSRR